MASRVIGYSSNDRRRDRRRPVALEAWIDGFPVEMLDLSLSGVGAGTAELAQDGRLRLREGQRALLEFADDRDRRVEIEVRITYVSQDDGRFGATFKGLSSKEFDVVQDLLVRRRAAAG